MRVKKGSNQYKLRYYIPLWKMLLMFILLVIVIIIYFGYKAQHPPEIISPLQDSVLNVPIQVVYAAGNEKSEIIAYIAKTFEKEGTATQVWAIKCFYSESGLRTDAYNFNSNGTEDKGIAQINSVHRKSNLYDFKTNINAAYQIYKRSGKNAWFGRDC